MRTEREAGQPERVILTFKGPVQPGAMKMREEHETTIGNGAALAQLLEALSMRAWFRYQKYREELSAPDLTIAIDDTPVGTFVELEGSEAAIMAMTQALGRTPADFILDSYYRLFMDRRDQFRLAESPHMVFGAE